MNDPRIRRRVVGPTFLACLVTGLASCARCPRHGGAPGEGRAPQWVETDLYCGLSRPDGTVVTTDQWDDFLARTVTPAFPEGFTVVDAAGQYRGSDGRVHREPSKLLIILHAAEQLSADEVKLDHIAVEYAHRFGQESVLRTDRPARVGFLTTEPATRP